MSLLRIVARVAAGYETERENTEISVLTNVEKEFEKTFERSCYGED